VFLATLGPAAGAGAALPSIEGGSDGQIVGRVIDRTAPVHALAGIQVRLSIIERGITAERRAATTDALGRFAFTGLPVGGIRVFVVSIEHGGVTYQSSRIVLTPQTPVRSVALTAYESAPNRSALRVGLVFGVVEIARGGVRVSVIQQWLNPTDRTAVTTAQDPLAVSLPPAAEGVTPLSGWRDPHVSGGRIEDAVPVLPGSFQVAFAYGLAAGRSALVIPWNLPEGAQDVEILVARQGERIAAEGLREIATVTEAGREYARWSGGPVPRGGGVSVRLDGIPSDQDVWPGVVAAALAAVLTGGLVLALRRARGAAI
jgi:hypothetical protein